MAKGHGGRRVGAGRKPKKRGERTARKTADFSTRITRETRMAMEAEARAAGLSVSAMAEVLIKRGIAVRHDAQRKDATRALCHLIGELAGMVGTDRISEDREAFAWWRDPFMFEAFKLSIAKFMNSLQDALRLRGEMLTPVDRMPELKGTTLWGPLESAEARAEWAAAVLLDRAQTARPVTEAEIIARYGAEFVDQHGKDVSDLHYGLYDAGSALKLQ